MQETRLELTSAYYLQVFGVKTNKFFHLNCPSVFTMIIFPLLSCYDYSTLVQVAQSSWCFADSILIGEFSVFRSLLTAIIFQAKRTMYFLQLLKTNLLSESIHILSDPICIYLLGFRHNNSRIKSKICSKLTVETTDIVLVSLLLSLNIFDTFLVFCFVFC